MVSVNMEIIYLKIYSAPLSSLYTSIKVIVIPAGKQVSNARDGHFKYVHVVWIPAVHAGMTSFWLLCITTGTPLG